MCIYIYIYIYVERERDIKGPPEQDLVPGVRRLGLRGPAGPKLDTKTIKPN